MPHSRSAAPAAKPVPEPPKVPTKPPAIFKVGDKVVYPNHGVALIEEIQKVAVGAHTVKCYCLRVAANRAVLKVPVNNTDTVGLRRVIDEKEAARLMRRLRDTDVATGNDWKERFQENADKMRTGDLRDVVEVMKSLTVLAQQKELSDRERRMLEKARYLIVSELAAAESLTEDKVEERIDKALGTLVKKMGIEA
jgi:CarD family transcriptional regulator